MGWKAQLELFSDMSNFYDSYTPQVRKKHGGVVTLYVVVGSLDWAPFLSDLWYIFQMFEIKEPLFGGHSCHPVKNIHP